MNWTRILLVSYMVFYMACTANNLDDAEPVDCSISTLAFTFKVTDADCGQTNGIIVVTATGGNPPYNYTIGDQTTQTTNIFDNLGAGNYNVITTDNVQCSKTENVLVLSKGGFQAMSVLEPSGCKTANGSITVQPVNGVSPYMFKLGSKSQSDPTFNNLVAGQYEVLITDATGCDFSLIESILTGISYSTSVEPIIATNCAISGCHNGTQFPDFRELANVQSNKTRIREFTQSGFMPRNGSLTQAEKDAISCWIDDGAKDN